MTFAESVPINRTDLGRVFDLKNLFVYPIVNPFKLN